MAIKIQNSTIIDDGRNIVNAGITTVTSVSIGNTQVISSARQLQNIASLDATTTATIESAIANAPNNFTDLSVTGIATISANSSTNALRITQTGTGNALLVEDSANPDATPFVVRGDGNVGIGTVNPLSILHLQSNSPVMVYVDDDSPVDNKNWNIGVSNIYYYWQAVNDSGAGGGNGFRISRSAEQIQTFEATASGVPWFMVNNSTQRVGVGTTLPGATFQVSGTTWLDNTTDTSIRAQGLTVGIDPGANYSPGSDPGDGLRNTSLIVKGATRPVILTLRNVDDGNAFWDFVADGNTDKFYIQRGGGAFSPIVTWDTSGNVGVGTISPQSRLAVGGTITELFNGTYWNIVSQADVGYGASQIPLNQYLGQLAFLDDFSPNGLRRDGGGEDDVTVNSSGFVGIGTTNAISKLHVVGGDVMIGVSSVGVGIGTSGSIGRVLMGPSTARSGFFYAPNVSPVLQIEGNTDNTRGISIVASHGNHPTQDAYIALCRQNSSVIGGHTAVIPGNSLGDISFQGSDSATFVDAARIECYVDGGVGLGSMPGRIEFRTTPSGSFIPATRMTINNSGNVLIGSTTSIGTASQNLQVTGGGYFSGNVGIGTTIPRGRLHLPYNGSLGAETLRIGNEETTFAENIYSIFWGQANTTQTGMGPYPNARGFSGRQGLGIHVSSNDEFTIKSSGWTNIFGVQGGSGLTYILGNLGIGITNPSQKLQVVGNGLITGNLTVSSSNVAGGGIILSDDGDIVDNNDGFASMRFTGGVRIYSANKSGVPRITLASSGTVNALTYETGVIGSQTSGILTTTATTANQVLDSLPTATFQTARYQVSIACTGQLVTAGMSTIVTSVGAITAGAGYTEATYTNVALTGGSGNDARANIGIGLSFNSVGFTSATDLIVTTTTHGLPSGVGTIAVSFASSIPNSDFTGIAVTAGAIYYAVGVGTTTLQLFNNANGTSQVTGIGTTIFTGVGNTMTKAGGVASVQIVSPGSGYSPGNTLSATLGTLGSGFSFVVSTAVRNYQSTDIMILQSVGSAATACDYMEYATISNSEILGSFGADISGANARLLFTPTYRNNTIKIVRSGITV